MKAQLWPRLWPRWMPMAILLLVLTIGGLSLVVFTKVHTASAGAASSDCRVALVISREEAEADGVEWAVAKEQQGRWSSTYRCGDEAAKMAALQAASEAKHHFLASR